MSMDIIISCCNENQGFFSAVLCSLTVLTSLLTVFFTWKVGMMPYRKRLSVILYYWGNDEEGHHLRISIVNVGRLPIYIKQVEVKDKKGIFLGSMNTTFDMDKNFLIISPNEVLAQEISVENKNRVFDKFGTGFERSYKSCYNGFGREKIQFF